MFFNRTATKIQNRKQQLLRKYSHFFSRIIRESTAEKKITISSAHQLDQEILYIHKKNHQLFNRRHHYLIGARFPAAEKSFVDGGGGGWWGGEKPHITGTFPGRESKTTTTAYSKIKRIFSAFLFVFFIPRENSDRDVRLRTCVLFMPAKR